MERDGLLDIGSKSGYISPRRPQSGEFLPSIVYKDKPLAPGQDFVPDELIVKVVAMSPHQPGHYFKYLHFPIFNARREHLGQHLQLHKGEQLHEALSDFALLCYLPQLIDVELVCEVAKCVRTKSPLTEAKKRLVENALQSIGT